MTALPLAIPTAIPSWKAVRRFILGPTVEEKARAIDRIEGLKRAYDRIERSLSRFETALRQGFLSSGFAPQIQSIRNVLADWYATFPAIESNVRLAAERALREGRVQLASLPAWMHPRRVEDQPQFAGLGLGLVHAALLAVAAFVSGAVVAFVAAKATMVQRVQADISRLNVALQQTVERHVRDGSISPDFARTLLLNIKDDLIMNTPQQTTPAPTLAFTGGAGLGLIVAAAIWWLTTKGRR